MPTRIATDGFYEPEGEIGGRWSKFDQNFSGASTISCAYKLDLLSDQIEVSFLAEKEPYIGQPLRKPGFNEGLWRYDCGELWLANPETGRYIEFNLAPNGDWWTCVFTTLRKRDLSTSPPQCKTEVHLSKSAWFAKLTVSQEEIERCLGTSENLVGNVTLVLDGCDHPDEKLENLHSAVPLGAHDFHRPQDWVPLSDLI